MVDAFDRWWKSSKYMQVVFSGANERQIALDAWNACATLEAQLAEKQAVRVKPLVWRGEITKYAQSPFGAYTIDQTRATPTRFIWSAPIGDWMTVETEAEAKAAAQADYERRILSALDAPVPKVTEVNADVKQIADIVGYHMAAIVSRNNQPDMSGDQRARMPHGLRRQFDDACAATADAIRAALEAQETRT